MHFYGPLTFISILLFITFLILSKFYPLVILLTRLIFLSSRTVIFPGTEYASLLLLTTQSLPNKLQHQIMGIYG